ncbi:hypothetical protein [Tessaracoccus sp.]
MGEWIGVVVALGVGVPLLVLALYLDVRGRRKADEVLTSAPVRGNPAVDALLPTYVSQDDVDAMVPPGRGREAAAGEPVGRCLGFGHVDPDFATAGQVAELTNAAILMVSDDVLSMRELLVVLSGASLERPLVIAAASFHPEVMATLRANRRATGLPVVAVEANPAELLQLQDIVGGVVLSSADLKSGWVPQGTFGTARVWRSDRRSIRVVGPAPGDGEQRTTQA